MKFFYGVFTFVILLCSGPIYASDSTATMGSQTSTDEADSNSFNKKFEENSDITDAKLRAQSGSLSRYSLRFNLSYFGPPVGDLGALSQPNPDQTVSNKSVAISGSTGFRYRFDSATSLSLTAGISDEYPFREEQKLDINDPSISLDQAFRWGELQMLSSPRVTMTTSQVYKDVGEKGGVGYSIAAVHNLGESNFAAGAESGVSYEFFDRDYRRKDKKVTRGNVNLSPMLKYNFSDRVSLNTAVGLSFYNLRSNSSVTALDSHTVTQMLGIGYAITRDIFISPSLRFYPTSLAMNTTTIDISTVFSVL